VITFLLLIASDMCILLFDGLEMSFERGVTGGAAICAEFANTAAKSPPRLATLLEEDRFGDRRPEATGELLPDPPSYKLLIE
jgi:hypothetical protein